MKQSTKYRRDNEALVETSYEQKGREVKTLGKLTSEQQSSHFNRNLIK